MSDADIPLNNVYARALVWSMFRSSADEDYLFARWAARAGSPYMFFWNAQQCIEKYLKGSLLLNGKSVSKFGHDLGELLASLSEFAGDLLPTVLCPPNYWVRDRRIVHRPFEPFCDFVERINSGGSSSNRYRHGGYLHFGEDLHKLDETCFQLRRLVFPLGIEYSSFHPNYRAYIADQVNHQPHLPFDFLSNGNEDERAIKTEVITWRNFSFFEAEARKGGKLCTGISMGMSEIEINIHDEHRGVEAIDWLLANCRFSKSERVELLALLQGQDNER